MTVDMTIIGQLFDHPGYFTASWPGMRELTRRMAAKGMLVTDATKPPTGPPIEELAGMPPEEREVAGAWLRYHPEGSVGIPWWKLHSNDYWHVTSEECRQAMEVWESSGDPAEDVDEWWADWLRFLEAGAVADGFTVA